MACVMAIFAHSDDTEIWAGGTLYKIVSVGTVSKSAA